MTRGGRGWRRGRFSDHVDRRHGPTNETPWVAPAPTLLRHNPRYAARAELTALLNRAISLSPATLRDELLLHRARARRTGKPL